MRTIKIIYQISASLTNLLCWYSCNNGIGFYVFCNYCTRANNSSFAYADIVKHGDV